MFELGRLAAFCQTVRKLASKNRIQTRKMDEQLVFYFRNALRRGKNDWINFLIVQTLFQDASILFGIEILLRAGFKTSFKTMHLASMYDFSRSETLVFVVGRLYSMFGIAQRSKMILYFEV